MVYYDFCLAICTHLGVEVEGYSRKSQRLGEGVTEKAGGGGCRGRAGITGVRTAGSVMFLDNNKNDGLGEDKKIIC